MTHTLKLHFIVFPIVVGIGILLLSACKGDGVYHLQTDPRAKNLIAKTWTLLYIQLVDTSNGVINIISTLDDSCVTTLNFQISDLITQAKHCMTLPESIMPGTWTWYSPPINDLNVILNINPTSQTLLSFYHYTEDTLQLREHALIPNSDNTKYYIAVETYIIK